MNLLCNRLYLLSMKKIVIAGTGYPDILSICNDLNKTKEKLKIIGFLDDNPLNKKRNLYGHKIIGGFSWIKDNKEILVINSIFRNPSLREEAHNKLISFGAKIGSLIHPSVYGEYAQINNGVIIGRNVVLEPGVSIGSHTVILNNSVISHNSKIGSFCFIGNNVAIQGGNVIENSVFIAAGTSTNPNISIGQNAIIGLNSVITSNVEQNNIVASYPAKILMRNKKNEFKK